MAKIKVVRPPRPIDPRGPICEVTLLILNSSHLVGVVFLYVHTRKGFVYTAFVNGVYFRRIIMWAAGRSRGALSMVSG